GQPTIKSLAYEAIDGTEKGGESFAGTGRGRDQHIASGGNRGPRVSLGRGRRGEALVEPRANCGVKKRHVHRETAVKRSVGRIPEIGIPPANSTFSRLEGCRGALSLLLVGSESATFAAFLPQTASNLERIDLMRLPPPPFVSGCMILGVVDRA